MSGMTYKLSFAFALIPLTAAAQSAAFPCGRDGYRVDGYCVVYGSRVDSAVGRERALKQNPSQTIQPWTSAERSAPGGCEKDCMNNEEMALYDAINRACKAPPVTRGNTAKEKVDSAWQRLRPEIIRRFPGENIIVATVQSDVVNAFTLPRPGNSLVCIPTRMVEFLGYNEDEIAFTLGHEIGHAVDETCKRAKGLRNNSPAIKRECESRADRVGLDLLIKARYSPFAAAGMFGRFEMFTGDSQSGVWARFKNLSEDHPITPDRIANMRKMLLDYERIASAPLAKNSH